MSSRKFSIDLIGPSSDVEMDHTTELSSVADESDVAPRKSHSRRSSSASKSENDFIDDDSEGDESDAPKARKKTSKARPSLKSGKSSESGSNMFLTAAEQRASEKKTDKKSGEDPFDFLQDVRDVCFLFFLNFKVLQFY